jgi:hypothetical protein
MRATCRLHRDAAAQTPPIVVVVLYVQAGLLRDGDTWRDPVG